MRTNLMTAALAVVSCVVCGAAFGATPVGRWDFEQNLNPTTGAAPLTAGVNPVQYEPVTIGGASGYAARWPQAAEDAEQFFAIANPIGANGGGTLTNQYSVVMDVMFPAAGANGGFTSLVQTGADPHGSDGDLFVRGDGGAGISGDYSDAATAARFPYGQWNRVVWTVDTTMPAGSDASGYRIYLNGQLQNVVQSPSGWSVDGRYALGNTFSVFADEDGETNAGDISTLMFFNGALSAAEVAALGGPQAAVPEPAALATVAMASAGLVVRRRRR